VLRDAEGKPWGDSILWDSSGGGDRPVTPADLAGWFLRLLDGGRKKPTIVSKLLGADEPKLEELCKRWRKSQRFAFHEGVIEALRGMLQPDPEHPLWSEALAKPFASLTGDAHANTTLLDGVPSLGLRAGLSAVDAVARLEAATACEDIAAWREDVVDMSGATSDTKLSSIHGGKPGHCTKKRDPRAPDGRRKKKPNAPASGSGSPDTSSDDDSSGDDSDAACGSATVSVISLAAIGAQRPAPPSPEAAAASTDSEPGSAHHLQQRARESPVMDGPAAWKFLGLPGPPELAASIPAQTLAPGKRSRYETADTGALGGDDGEHGSLEPEPTPSAKRVAPAADLSSHSE
jgi:hypothetical protein